MVSEAKLAANRRNALRSTGPRTPEGKARSASNSATHNLRSRKPLELTAEDHEAIAQISRHFRPGACQQTPAEEAVLLDFATAVHIRTQVEHALDEAFCTNEPTALKYLDRRHSAALTRFNRAYDAYKALCTNEPAVSPASHQYQSDTSAGHPGFIADANRTATHPDSASGKESAQAATASGPYPDKYRTESTDSQADTGSAHSPSSHPAQPPPPLPSDLYTDKISPRARDGPPEGPSTKRFLQSRSVRRKQQRIEPVLRAGEIAVPVGKLRQIPAYPYPRRRSCSLRKTGATAHRASGLNAWIGAGSVRRFPVFPSRMWETNR